MPEGGSGAAAVCATMRGVFDRFMSDYQAEVFQAAEGKLPVGIRKDDNDQEKAPLETEISAARPAGGESFFRNLGVPTEASGNSIS